ncbi:MAG: hypothetical protein AAF939_07300 [Planctomycetota bacterium]
MRHSSRRYHNTLIVVISGHCPDAAVYKMRLSLGDRGLLCSDGVSGELSDEEIKVLLRDAVSPE